MRPNLNTFYIGWVFSTVFCLIPAGILLSCLGKMATRWKIVAWAAGLMATVALSTAVILVGYHLAWIEYARGHR